MNTEIAKKRINQVLRVDSIDSTDSDFLATHVPLRKIAVKTQRNGSFDEVIRSEEDIYKDIFENEYAKDEHQLVIVEGSSGAGKSHFIRWIGARLAANPENRENDAIILIRRSDNTLKGTIRQLLDMNEVRELADKEAYERLVNADQVISEQKFKLTIYHSFIVEIENDTQKEVLSSMKRKKLIALLNNSLFQEKLMSAGGPIDRIYSKIISNDANSGQDIVAQFTAEDMTIDIDFFNQIRDEADKKAQDMAERLLEGDDDGFIQKITDYMNSFVETVIQSSTGIKPGDFEDIFKDIRRELGRRGKGLILLIEDITSFTGVNKALLNALIIGHTGTNSGLCRLISFVGTTSEYYRQFRDNYIDRITKQISIQDGAIGENKNDLIQFVAKYLNAVSLSSEVLDEWVRNGAYPEEMPVYEDKEHSHWDSFALASKKKISLFPFTQNAIINLYEAMARHKTPRYIIRDIVEPALNEAISDITSFPHFCIGWRSPISEAVESRLGSVVSSLDLPDEAKTEYRKRLLTFIRFWTDKTLDVTNDGCISGVSTRIFMELAFDEFVSKLTSTATVKKAESVPKNPAAAEEKLHERVVTAAQKTAAVPVQPDIDPKRQKQYDDFKDNVSAWHHDGKMLIRFLDVRNSIGSFVYESINWQQEGVPIDSKHLVADSVVGKLIGFERQDQGKDKCMVIFPDNEETYKLLLCFGKWIYLGDKSWDFPNAANSVFFVTSWLERNKSKFVEAVKNAVNNSLPAYMKAAMTGQVYKRILSGKMANTRLDRVGTETFLVPDVVKTEPGMGHSQEWRYLHKLLFDNEMCGAVYTSSVRYFNLIQGGMKNTDSYVLNYSLYKNAVKEMRKSGFMLDSSELDEKEECVKSKREIFNYVQNVSSKIHKAAESEAALARTTALEVINYFDNFDIEDDVEASDIRTLIADIQEFYEKVLQAGANIKHPAKEQFTRLRDSASVVASAMSVIQADYSCEADIDILLAFSADPIGKVLPFLQFLKQANADIERVGEYMLSEKRRLAEQGIWNDSPDLRFQESEDGFAMLLSAFEEVQ